MDELKISTNVHLPPNPMVAGVPVTMGQGVRGGTNGRLYCQVGLHSYRSGARQQES
jgi:hypothetical protein